MNGDEGKEYYHSTFGNQNILKYIHEGEMNNHWDKRKTSNTNKLAAK